MQVGNTSIPPVPCPTGERKDPKWSFLGREPGSHLNLLHSFLHGQTREMLLWRRIAQSTRLASSGSTLKSWLLGFYFFKLFMCSRHVICEKNKKLTFKYFVSSVRLRFVPKNSFSWTRARGHKVPSAPAYYCSYICGIYVFKAFHHH